MVRSLIGPDHSSPSNPETENTILSQPSRFDMICEANRIEHWLTKPNHPSTNGQVERMNRTIKDATTKRYHYDSHNQLCRHLELFLDAYNGPDTWARGCSGATTDTSGTRLP
jgi:hypothetical protein